MSKHKTVCFIDFDHTLFDTDQFFHIDVRNCFYQYEIDTPLWRNSYAAVLPTGYTPEKHIEAMYQQSGKRLPINTIKDIILYSFSDLTRYLFPDVLQFLGAAKKLGVRLCLLSFGDQRWQSYKVKSCGIWDYFDNIFLTEKELTKVDRIRSNTQEYEKVIMVDNNPSELDIVKKEIPQAETYCINRVPDEFRISLDELSCLRFFDAREYLDKSVITNTSTARA